MQICIVTCINAVIFLIDEIRILHHKQQ